MQGPIQSLNHKMTWNKAIVIFLVITQLVRSQELAQLSESIDHFDILVPGFKEKFIARQRTLAEGFSPQQRTVLLAIATSNRTDVAKVQEAVRDPQIISVLVGGAEQVLREHGVSEGLVEFMAEVMRQGLLHADMGQMTTRQAAAVAIDVVPKWVVKYRQMNETEKAKLRSMDPKLVTILENPLWLRDDLIVRQRRGLHDRYMADFFHYFPY